MDLYIEGKATPPGVNQPLLERFLATVRNPAVPLADFRVLTGWDRAWGWDLRHEAWCVLRASGVIEVHVFRLDLGEYGGLPCDLRALGFNAELVVRPMTWAGWLCRLHRPYMEDDEEPPDGTHTLPWRRPRQDLVTTRGGTLNREAWNAAVDAGTAYERPYPASLLPDFLAADYAGSHGDTAATTDDCAVLTPPRHTGDDPRFSCNGACCVWHPSSSEGLPPG